MIRTATVSSANQVGTLTYNWSVSQTTGTTLPINFTQGTPTTLILLPDDIVWQPLATFGTYTFLVNCVINDSGVGGCTQVRQSFMYFDDVPPTCTLTVTPIGIT